MRTVTNLGENLFNAFGFDTKIEDVSSTTYMGYGDYGSCYVVMRETCIVICITDRGRNNVWVELASGGERSGLVASILVKHFIRILKAAIANKVNLKPLVGKLNINGFKINSMWKE